VRPELLAEALKLYEEGGNTLKAQQTNEAISTWEAAAKAAERDAQGSTAAWRYRRVGQVHETGRQWKEASQSHQSAWEILKAGGDAAAKSRTLVAMARCAQNLGDSQAAKKLFEDAQQIDQASTAELWVAGDLNSLGNLSLGRGDLEAALGYHLAALEIKQRLIPFSLSVAGSLNNLAAIAWSRGDLSAVEKYSRGALTIREKLAPNSLDVAQSLTSLGTAAWSRGDLKAAQDYHSRALEIKQRLAPDSMDVATSLNNLGLVATDRGDVQAGQDYYRRALSIQERVAANSMELAWSLTSLGNLAWSRGDLETAQAYHTRALEIRQQRAPNAIEVAGSLNNLGLVAKARGNLQSAQDYYRRAIEIYERLAPNSLGAASILNNLGTVALDRGDLEAAQDYQSRALAIKERLSPDSLAVAGTLINQGEIAYARGDFPAAQGYFIRALGIRERLAPDSLSVAGSLNDLGVIAGARGDLKSAQEYHNRALAIRERLAPDSLDIVESLVNLGNSAVREQRFSDARPLFTRAIAILETQRIKIPSSEARALLVAQHAEPYTGLLRVCLALDDLPGALSAAERSRARSLLDLLNEARVDIRGGVDPVLLQRERSLQESLDAKAARRMRLLSGQHTQDEATAASKEIDVITVDYDRVQQEIRANSPRFAALTEVQPLGLKSIQEQVLDPDSLLLEYLLGDDASYLLAVTKTTIAGYKLPARAEIEKETQRVRDLLTAPTPRPGETAAQRQARIRDAAVNYQLDAAALSQIVLGPIASQLGTKRLLIVASGALDYLPFAVLPIPRTSGAAIPDQGSAFRPLVAEHEIVNLPSASALAVVRRELSGRPPAPKAAVVLADPVFSAGDARVVQGGKGGPINGKEVASDLARAMNDVRGELARLVMTRDEAQAIISVTPRNMGLEALDFRASVATATSNELSQYRIVHFATHGLLDSEHPELSGLVLSLVDEQGKPQDGFLRLHQIYNLRLPADLVVLSACQTGLGKQIRGEGLVGLTRGFMYAGAARVVASLWQVNDAATAELMKRFYRGMLRDGMRPAAALRAAQLEMWHKPQWQSPFYWGAFVLQGEYK